jgi:hypothetical protein
MRFHEPRLKNALREEAEVIRVCINNLGVSFQEGSIAAPTCSLNNVRKKDLVVAIRAAIMQ